MPLNKASEYFLDKYKPTMTVDNIINEGVIFKDQNNRSVGVSVGEIREKLVHTSKPYADIMVIGLNDGILIGWIDASAMIDADDRYLVHLDSLNKLPRLLDFRQDCAHLSVHGGVNETDGPNWRCLGCGKIIVC